MTEKMSTSSQNNGKKSSNSSIVNTPSSTPLTSIANGNTQANTQSSPPPNNNAPKYGTLVPNRIFVGGISANTTEGELMQLFSNYGTVKAAKIIQDRAGVSKGYGFITFESEDDAKRPLREAENIVLRERKLNIAPAIKKQPFSRAFDASSPPAVPTGNPAQFFFPPGTVPYFQGGVTYYPQPAPAAPGDLNTQQPVYQPPPVYPAQTGPPQTATYPSMMFPAQTIYMPQQYPMPMPYDYNYYQNNGAAPSAQYVVGSQSGPGGPQCPPMPPTHSPPRPSCYGQQMPAYSPADPMFYNLPVYGATLEGPPIYTEAFELGTTGPYSEDTYNNMGDYTITTQDVESPSVNDNDCYHPSTTQNNVPTTNDSNGTDKIFTHGQLEISNNTVCAEDRKSNTPVVSLLSIEQQQEKDYLSMQGGRRRNSSVPSDQNKIPIQHVYPSNGLINSMNVFSMNYSQPQHYGGSYPDYRRVNGYDNRRNKTRRRTYDKRSNDHSSRSSLRTDSNSSASCVDENKNEDKTNTRTPPPAPYSPMTHQYKIIGNARNYQNAMRYNNSNNYRHTYDPTSQSKSYTNSNNSSNVSCPNFPPSSISQVHVSSSTQNFASQARRSRRSIRRSGGAGMNEIGAGDASLPGDVGDMCKKFETMKL